MCTDWSARQHSYVVEPVTPFGAVLAEPGGTLPLMCALGVIRWHRTSVARFSYATSCSPHARLHSSSAISAVTNAPTS